jgi:hypothetical protein
MFFPLQVSGSISCLFKSGFNATIAAGNRKLDTSGQDDATFYYGKLGYITNLVSCGDTAFAIDYGEYSDIKVENDEAETAGMMCVQNLKKWNTQIYLGYRHYELDRNAEGFDDIEAVMGGIRIKF